MQKHYQAYFAYLRIVLYIFSLENSVMIMSGTDTIYANFFLFHAVTELWLGKPATSETNVTAELVDVAKLWTDCSLENRFWLES